MYPCPRVHFERLIFPWTDVGLGNCSYLDTCRHMKTCRYVHYQLDDQADSMTPEAAGAAAKPKASRAQLSGGACAHKYTLQVPVSWMALSRPASSLLLLAILSHVLCCKKA